MSDETDRQGRFLPLSHFKLHPSYFKLLIAANKAGAPAHAAFAIVHMGRHCITVTRSSRTDHTSPSSSHGDRAMGHLWGSDYAANIETRPYPPASRRRR